MAFRDRMEDLTARWQAWPRGRRIPFVVALVAAVALVAWLGSDLVAGRPGLPVVAAGPAVVSPQTAEIESLEGQGAEREAALEEALAAKARTLLERVVGEDRVLVQVRVELDWSRREATRERFDPEGQVERSEERGEAAAGTRATERVEYDVSKEVTREVTPGGGLRRLHVAVLLDEMALEGSEGPDPAALEALAKQAVGFSEARGDVFSFARMPFRATWPEAGSWPWAGEPWLPAAALLGALALVAWWLLRRAGVPVEALELPTTTAELEAALLQRGFAALPAGGDAAPGPSVAAEPDAAASAIRAWLAER